MHCDIAAMERKKSSNAIVTTYWQYKKLLAQQLRDDLCNDIELKLHPDRPETRGQGAGTQPTPFPSSR
jgi:hypothetical protein